MKTLHKIGWWALMAFFGWVSVTSLIYRFREPGKTETELMMHIPRSFILDFKE